MRRYQTVLGLLLLLCILLNCAGCDFRTNYDVFSSGNRKITSVSSSLRDHIGIVLDNEELVVCDYKGHELCRRCFDKRIKDVDVFNGKALVRFEDESIELYSVNSGAMDLIVQRDFATLASPIKNAEIVGWADESVGIVVLLEKGAAETGASVDEITNACLDLMHSDLSRREMKENLQAISNKDVAKTIYQTMKQLTNNNE